MMKARSITLNSIIDIRKRVSTCRRQNDADHLHDNDTLATITTPVTDNTPLHHNHDDPDHHAHDPDKTTRDYDTSPTPRLTIFMTMTPPTTSSTTSPVSPKLHPSACSLCLQSTRPPHWGNECPLIGQEKGKRTGKDQGKETGWEPARKERWKTGLGVGSDPSHRVMRLGEIGLEAIPKVIQEI